MTRRLHPYSIGIALAAMAPAWAPSILIKASSDPYQSRPRSKGEKARNRKNRGGRL